MKKEQLSEILGELDDRIVSESANARMSSGRVKAALEKKSRGILRFVETAACLLLAVGIIGASIILPSLTRKSGPGSDSQTDTPDYSYVDYENADVIPVTYKSAGILGNGLIDEDNSGGYWKKAVLIRSMEELETHIETCISLIEDHDYMQSSIEKTKAELEKFPDSYSEEYFEEHDLILLPVISGSGSDSFMLSALVRQDDGLVLTVNVPQWGEGIVGTDNVLFFCWAIETGVKLEAEDTVTAQFNEIDSSAVASYFRTGLPEYESQPMCKLIRTRAELEKYLERYTETSDELDAMKKTLEKYTENYFKANYLAIVGITVGSGSYKLNVSYLHNDWDGVSVMVDTITEKGMDVTADLATWTVIVEGRGTLPEGIIASVDTRFVEKDSEDSEEPTREDFGTESEKPEADRGDFETLFPEQGTSWEYIPVTYKHIDALEMAGEYRDAPVIIRSAEELEGYVAEYRKSLDNPKDYAEALRDFQNSYKQDFFEEHDLILGPLRDWGTEETALLHSLCREEDGLYLHFKTSKNTGGELFRTCIAVETGVKLREQDEVMTSYYQGENPQAVYTYSVSGFSENGAEPVFTVIRNREELEAYLAQNSEIGQAEKQLESYTEEYFTSGNHLLLVHASLNSAEVEGVHSLWEDGLKIEVKVTTPDRSEDADGWLAVIENIGTLPENVRTSVEIYTSPAA